VYSQDEIVIACLLDNLWLDGCRFTGTEQERRLSLIGWTMQIADVGLKVIVDGGVPEDGLHYDNPIDCVWFDGRRDDNG